MSDDVGDPRDAFEEREHELVRGQGVTETDYALLLELASEHAAATPVFPGAPPWRSVGPRNLGGRIIALEQDPTDPRVIYAGSAHGGLWRSINTGDTWQRLGDAAQVFPVGAIGIPPKA